MALIGPRLTKPRPRLPHGVREILTEAWERPFTTKSNLAKAQADEVAAAASLGLITTRLGKSAQCGRMWRITVRGLQLIHKL